MSNIRDTSHVTPFGETWFVFRDGEREIVAHNSLLSKESIFVNRKLVSSKRSLKRIGKHRFVFEEDEYEVILNVIKIVNGEIECSLMKDGICIEKLRAYYNGKPSQVNYLKSLASGAVIAIFASCFAALFRISSLFPSIAGLGIYLLFFVSKKRGKFIVEKVNV
jgi:hypothetical protein